MNQLQINRLLVVKGNTQFSSLTTDKSFGHKIKMNLKKDGVYRFRLRPSEFHWYY